jgi:hypothetical protein
MPNDFDALVSRLKKKYGEDSWKAFGRCYLFDVGGDVGHVLVTDEGIYELGKGLSDMPLETYIKLLDLPEKPKEDLTGSDQE